MSSAKISNDFDTPGGVLSSLFMRPLGLTAYRLSSDLGVAPIAVSHILRGKRAISATMALRLGAYFGVEPAFWLALQAAHDLQNAAAAATTSNGGQPKVQAVKKCEALQGRAFVLRETKSDGVRRWEVLMVRAAIAASTPVSQKRNPALALDEGGARTGAKAKMGLNRRKTSADHQT